MIALIILSSLLSLILSHPQIYNLNRNEACYNPGPPKVFSYHVHVLFWHHNEEHTKGALEFREKFIARFKNKLHDNCKSQSDQVNMCMFRIETEDLRPFLTGHWAAFFMPEDFQEVATWIMQNRGIYDAVIHPNTGCVLEDHSWWVLWAGTPWQLDLELFNDPGSDEPWEPAKVRGATKRQIFNDPTQTDLIKNFLNEEQLHDTLELLNGIN
jgi:aromatic ring-cleaving dioxygenase